MSIRYGSSTTYECGSRKVSYQPDGCVVCLPVKLGERQLFEVDFGSEVKCNPRRIGCTLDYDEIVSITSFNASPETVFGQGSIQVTNNGFSARIGVVSMLVDTTDPLLQSDEKWSIDVTVEFESGRLLKQCFQIRTIPCGGQCAAEELEVKNDCCGNILKSSTNCSDGIFFVYDEAPRETRCVEVSASSDTYYSIDPDVVGGLANSPMFLSSGIKVQLKTPSDIQNFRMKSCDGDCEEICVSRVFRD